MKPWESVQTSLDTLKSLCPDIEVHVLVLCGQNDAEYSSRGSTRNFEEVRAKFRNLVEKQLKKLEEEIPYATIYWVKPFDDPTIYLAKPRYKVLVEELESAICLNDRVITFGPFSSFESDQLHLTTTDRTKFANQVLDWFASL